MLTSIYLILSTLFIAWMFSRWSIKSNVDQFLKVVLFLLVALGCILILNHFGVIILLKWV